jgi:cell division protein ZapA (FtsZ GTPase activity inhibitor)
MIMNEKKSYKVQIFEEQYVLLSDESEAFVLKVAELVDAVMKEISHQSMITDPKKIAVLSALRIADKLLTSERDSLKDQQKKIALENYIDQELSILSL